VEEMGFPSPTFLPLATDPEIFSPGWAPANGRFSAPLAFVGDSMVRARRKWEKKVASEAGSAIAALSCDPLLKERGRDILGLLDFAGKGGLDHRSRMDMEAALTWRTTQDYRLRLVEAMMPLGLVVYGDPGWRDLVGEQIDLRPQVDYSRELPEVYRGTLVNLNCTSFQMRTAVNQRVFDVPACGGFVLSDYQGDMDTFFEVGREAVCFSTIEEAVDLAGYYLEDETERLKIAEAGRRRVLSEHTYEKRMGTLVEEMRRRFA
jgi:spore maturation protein CgeB